VFPVRYDRGFLNPEDGIHSHYRDFDRLDSVAKMYCVSCEVRTSFHIPDDVILHGHRCENLKSYIALIGWSL
jgi:hypothetical protein